MDEAIFSVVVPVYNGEAQLAEALESVSGQTEQRWECLIVDDGSTDRSADIIRQWAGRRRQRVEQLRHAEGGNRGVAASRNLAISRARTDWIAFLDQDDLWLPRKLESQSAFIRTRPDLAAASCWPLIVYQGVAPVLFLDLWSRTIRNLEGGLSENLGVTPFLRGCPMFVSGAICRRDALADAGGFPDGIDRISDWLLWARLARHRRLAIQREELGVYRCHGSNELLRLAAEPLGLFSACLEIHSRLASWIAEREGRDQAVVLRELSSSADFRRMARDLQMTNSRFWRALAGSSS